MDRGIIGVIFGGKTARSRDKHMIKLLNRFIVSKSKKPLVRAAKPLELPSKRPDSISYASRQKSNNLLSNEIVISEDWYVQIGAFKNKLNAHKAAKEARSAAPEQLANLPASLQKINTSSKSNFLKKSLWRVRIC